MTKYIYTVPIIASHTLKLNCLKLTYHTITYQLPYLQEGGLFKLAEECPLVASWKNRALWGCGLEIPNGEN
eukprot:8255860-Heterocapsa_arctica.AAC.1